MDKKYVAFLDILGFKELVANNSAETLKDIYSTVLTAAYDEAFTQLTKAIPFMDNGTIPVKSQIISDSIVLWTDNTDHGSFIKLAFVVQGLMLICFRDGLCVRGGIAIGEVEDFTVDLPVTVGILNSPIVIGKGLVNAFKLEKKQKWSGCIISNEAIKSFVGTVQSADMMDISSLEGYQIISLYDVPLGPSKTEKCYCINLISMDERVFKFQHNLEATLLNQVKEKFAMHGKSIEVEDVQIKIQNTADFLYFLCTKYMSRNIQPGN